MKQADCLRMALAELPQGTMEIVGRPAAEPGVLFTGTFQGETDGRGRMEVYPVFPGVEASFNTVLGTYAAFRHEAARSTLEINHCRLGRVGWDLRDGMSVYLGEGDLSLHSADCCADSVMHFPAEMYAGLMICVDLTHLAESPPPLLAEADFQAERRDLRPSGGTGAGGDLPAPVPAAGDAAATLSPAEAPGAAAVFGGAGVRRAGADPVRLPADGAYPGDPRIADRAPGPAVHH